MRGLLTSWTVRPNKKGIKIELHLDADFKDTDEVRKLYHEADTILCKLLEINKDAKKESEGK